MVKIMKKVLIGVGVAFVLFVVLCLFFVLNAGTSWSEMQSKNKPSDNTIIDLGDCEEKLKASNGITGDASLLIYKFYDQNICYISLLPFLYTFQNYYFL